MNSEIISLRQPDRWLDILRECYRYDFYHCPSYHEISVDATDHEAFLFSYHEGGYTIAIPLILRPVSEVEGLESFEYMDATSVYGYVGPVASDEVIPEKIINNFQVSLRKGLGEINALCAFSRLHPLIGQRPLLTGFGDIMRIGRTVSIDLWLPIDDQYACYRREHKRDITRLKQLGARCIEDEDGQNLDDFIQIYNENMTQVNAEERYFFKPDYFSRLLKAPDFEMHLFCCFLDDEMIGGGLFSLCNDVVQAHLVGARTEYRGLAPTKLLMDEVRMWANEIGALRFHLGGGLGSEEDSLFRFKSGFSDIIHGFDVWNFIVVKDEFRKVCNQKEHWNQSKGITRIHGKYFPRYRQTAT